MTSSTSTPKMKVYLAPGAIDEARELPYKTPQAFREHYEKPGNMNMLYSIDVDVPTVKMSIMPEGIDLKDGFNYVLFYSSRNELLPNTQGYASDRPPDTKDWHNMVVCFGENLSDGWDVSRAFDRRGCLELYYVGNNPPDAHWGDFNHNKWIEFEGQAPVSA